MGRIIKKNRLNMLVLSLACLIVFCTYLKFANSSSETFSLSTASKTIVIDAGHGGFDPGKTGISGTKEDEINLEIAFKLKSYLEQSGATVIMTRTDDEKLQGEKGNTHKRRDMNYRKEVIQASDADILVSIHQNAFTQSEVKGAQVFYYQDSEKAKLLANCVQTGIKIYADPENKRKIKSSKEYYILKISQMPGVIIECGFLTNLEEEAKLASSSYQDKIAWAIYAGIVEYFEALEP
ncbi:MAG: N-acetylmuramoyl-L-alanine amidase [Niameybacter sp.]|uniref:N-acetylmuramoyl-L-alanine amidase n=1 Tax=Niameybacter sp. TaxID=2033640 RepID=UPI002FC8CC0A